MTTLTDDVRLLPGDEEPCFPPNPAHARKHIPEEVLAEAQNLFETTDIPAAEIARRVGLNRTLLGRTALRKGWSRPDPKAMRSSVAKRVRARIEKELASVELSLAQSRSDEARAAARESAAILASLTRSLRELQAYDLAERRAEASAAPARDDGGCVDPATGYVDADDIDTFRIELAKRLDRLRLYYEAQEREEAAAQAEPGAAGS